MTRSLSRALRLCALAAAFAAHVSAQTSSERIETHVRPAAPESAAAQGLDEVLRLLREQRQEIERLRAQLDAQAHDLGQLRARVERGEAAAVASAPADASRGAAFAGALSKHEEGGQSNAPSAGAAQDDKLAGRMARVEEQAQKTRESLAKQLGSLTFSGDLRLRYESIYGQQNALASSDNPAVLGNELSSRQRFRVRARLAVKGKITDEFEWGLRLATGNTSDVISENQTLTDFFSRKPFALDQAPPPYLQHFTMQ
jgi:hypothetical protein